MLAVGKASGLLLAVDVGGAISLVASFFRGGARAPRQLHSLYHALETPKQTRFETMAKEVKSSRRASATSKKAAASETAPPTSTASSPDVLPAVSMGDTSSSPMVAGPSQPDHAGDITVSGPVAAVAADDSFTFSATGHDSLSVSANGHASSSKSVDNHFFT